MRAAAFSAKAIASKPLIQADIQEVLLIIRAVTYKRQCALVLSYRVETAVAGRPSLASKCLLARPRLCAHAQFNCTARAASQRALLARAHDHNRRSLSTLALASWEMMEPCRRKDTCSSANSWEVVVSHWDWEVVVDFSSKTLTCTATLDIRTLTEGVGSLVSLLPIRAL